METESEEKLPKEEEEKMGSESKDVEEREETKRDVSATAELTSDGRYKCRTCGQVFDTLEEHNEHHRMMHWQPEEQMPREGKPDEPSMRALTSHHTSIYPETCTRTSSTII